MAGCYDTGLKRRMRAERILLVLPLNVVVAARIGGDVDVGRLATALETLRKRHALLAVRMVIDEDDVAWYVSEGVPDFSIRVLPRESDDQWLRTVEEEYKRSLPLETGPLVRFTLLHSPEVSDLIICAHHAICDGLSLAYLIRDVLQHLAGAGEETEILPEPPLIDRNTVPSPPSAGLVGRMFIGIVNRVWSGKNIRFDFNDVQRLHRAFWERNGEVRVLAWEYAGAKTTALVLRCREEGVTVNTALWTAFLAAQHDVQGDSKPYHHRAALAVNTRDRLTVPVGEAFGFFASSLALRLRYDPRKDFWNAARGFHKRITARLEKTNLFRMLAAESLNPTLLDSLYFSKYGLLRSRTSGRFLKRMGWDRISYGYAITNVGRMSIPTVYGPLRLEAVYGPSFYSDVEEKIVGAITVGGRISFLLTYNATTISTDTAKEIRDVAMNHLAGAVEE